MCLGLKTMNAAALKLSALKEHSYTRDGFAPKSALIKTGASWGTSVLGDKQFWCLRCIAAPPLVL